MTDTIVDAAGRLRRGETTARALVEQALAAIERHQATTNAFTRVHADDARRAAAIRDRELAGGVDRGPLHGIPISVKDLIDEAGTPTTAGSRVLDDRIPAADATLVARLREAGAILVGRTNLHEFAYGTTSEDSAFGPVHHPLDPSRSPGGSSGGSAAAVATGMGLASIGTDTGGSVRIPSAICGLVGLKPTHGEVPLDGVIPLAPSLDHAGPLARCVQDAGWLFDVMAGRAPVRVPVADVAGLRLARLGGYFAGPLDPVVRDAFERGLERLVGRGVAIGVAELAQTAGIWDAYVALGGWEAAAWHARFLRERADRYTPAVRDRLLAAARIPEVRYREALTFASAMAEDVESLLAGVDALALPAVPILAPPLGAESVDLEHGASLTVRFATLKHTQPFNMTGHPAITLPLASAGLPAGLQLVGRRGDTRRLLAIAAAVESALAAGADA